MDLSEDEERLALAVFDPITNMAETDAAILDELLQQVNTGEAALQSLLADLAEQASVIPPAPPEEFGEYGEDIETEYCCPKCGYKWSGKPA